LFLDECLGSTDVSGALRAAGIRIELFHEHFDASTPDDKWLAEVGHRGWTALTKDQRIRRRQAEFEALLEANVAAFVLTSGNLTGPAMGRAFVLAYPRMQKMLRDYMPPFVAAVDADGRVRLLTNATRRAAKKKS
jgi:hypothetical protein